MRRYSVWCEDWSKPGPVWEVEVRRFWTRRGMVRVLYRFNGRVPDGARYRFFGKEGV